YRGIQEIRKSAGIFGAYEISINTIVFFMMKSRNLREKPKKRLHRKRAFSKMQLRDFCALKYIQEREK
ncbi:hypothetical protein, partial [Anaerobutyricum hallii]|uniref:hypothetical protein n=1 Tax=Anaerobutyricum hallii TaxID=39488 RepID=UPI00242C506A